MDLHQFTSRFPSIPSAKTTCRQCRLRKVRCDGHDDGCSNCLRLSFPCSLSVSAALRLAAGEDSTEELVVQLRPKRRRGSRACVGCRTQKVKCSGSLPSCSTCERRGLSCHYPALKRQAPSGAPQTIGVVPARPSIHDSLGRSTASPELLTSEPGNDDSPANQHIPQLVDRFFAHTYAQPSYAFLHPETTKEVACNGRLEKSLAFAICGVTTLHWPPGDSARSEADAGVWIGMAEQLMWQHIDSPSIPRLQALLLIINYRMETGAFQKGFMLLSLAARAAVALHLGSEVPGADDIANETQRRILWSLKLLDRYFSGGLPDLGLSSLEVPHLQLPSTELSFSGSTHRDDGGAYRAFTQLEALRSKVLRVTQEFRTLGHIGQDFAQLTYDIVKDLSEISTRVPSLSAPAAKRLDHLVEDPWLARHVALHLSWHQCYLSFHQLAVGFPDASPPHIVAGHRLSAENLCLEHGVSTMKIISALSNTAPGQLLLEFDVAICAYHAIRLVLFVSFSRSLRNNYPGDVDRPVALGQSLECIDGLRHLFPASPLVQPMIQDLERLTQGLAMFQRDDSPVSPAGSGSCSSSEAGSNSSRNTTQTTTPAQPSWRHKLSIHNLLQDEHTGPQATCESPSQPSHAKGERDSPEMQALCALFKYRATPANCETPSTPQGETALPSPASNRRSSFGLEEQASPVLNGRKEMLQFPIFPWYRRE